MYLKTQFGNYIGINGDEVFYVHKNTIRIETRGSTEENGCSIVVFDDSKKEYDLQATLDCIIISIHKEQEEKRAFFDIRDCLIEDKVDVRDCVTEDTERGDN